MIHNQPSLKRLLNASKVERSPIFQMTTISNKLSYLLITLREGFLKIDFHVSISSHPLIYIRDNTHRLMLSSQMLDGWNNI